MLENQVLWVSHLELLEERHEPLLEISLSRGCGGGGVLTGRAASTATAAAAFRGGSYPEAISPSAAAAGPSPAGAPTASSTRPGCGGRRRD